MVGGDVISLWCTDSCAKGARGGDKGAGMVARGDKAAALGAILADLGAYSRALLPGYGLRG